MRSALSRSRARFKAGSRPPWRRSLSIFYRDSAAISASSSSVSGSGLPFMLLAARAFADQLGHVSARHAVAGEARGSRATGTARDPGDAVVERRVQARRSASAPARGSARSAGLSGARAASARAFTRSTAGSSAAHTAPWGAANMPPIGAAKPCTAPSPALARHRPPSRLASASASRSAASIGFAGAGGGVRARQRRRRPPDPFARQPVGDGVGADRQERLDQLRQRVEAARRQHRRRQARQQIGIDDRQRAAASAGCAGSP